MSIRSAFLMMVSFLYVTSCEEDFSGPKSASAQTDVVQFGLSSLKRTRFSNWKLESEYEIRGVYEAEFGGGGIAIELIPYAVENDEETDPQVRYVAIWIETSAPAVKPKIRIYENLILDKRNFCLEGEKVKFECVKISVNDESLHGLICNGTFFSQK